jgi:peptidoglycan/LPS O-acetylase OafA/YrhL
VTKRLAPLDGLRAIAVLLVMISHARLEHIVPGGFGVTIFFFLSGYLISTLMRIEWERNHSISFKGFYLRRAVRILPPMLICYAAAFALAQGGLIGRPMNLAGIKWDLLFLTTYSPPLEPYSMVPIPLWSLNVEEHFYFIFPAIFLIILQFRNSTQFLIITALIALALLLRFIEFELGNGRWIYYWTHTRFDAILFGVLLTIDQSRGKSWGNRWSFFIGGVLAIIFTLLFRDDFFRATVRFTVQGVALFFIFKFLLEGPRNYIRDILESKPCKIVADWSYVLYLIHLPFLMTAAYMLTAIPLAFRFAVGFVAAFIFASLMHRYVELPLLRWRKRIEGGLQPVGPLTPKGVA